MYQILQVQMTDKHKLGSCDFFQSHTLQEETGEVF